LQPLVAPAVLLLCLPGAVSPVTVGLDDHSFVAPDEVHSEHVRITVLRVDIGVDLGHRYVPATTAGEE
jgi:hypothetical protein